MHGSSLNIQASKLQFRIFVILSALLVLLCAWLAYQLAAGKPYGQGFAMVLVITIVSIIVTVRQKTEHLFFNEGYLVQRGLFVRQSVYLTELVRAERYNAMLGSGPHFRLELHDEAGNRLIIIPSDFSIQDLNALVALIHPYIFVTRVDKNFMDLQFYSQQTVDAPKYSIWHIIRGTFLFVLLPCIILTALIVIWATATQQPAFR